MPWQVGIILVFPKGLLTLINVYKKVKIFEKIWSIKLRGNVDAPFGLKSFFFYISNPAKVKLK